MLIQEILEPYSCRYCGIPERGHGRQWDEIAGWHAWRAPYRWQILDRMRARREEPSATWRWQR